jgi:PAS domain S-box-containing protein
MIRRFANLSIRQKLTAMMLFTTATALILTCVTFVVVDVTLVRAKVHRDLDVLAEIVGANSTAALAFHDRDSATEILSALHAKTAIRAACIYGLDGRPFATYIAEPRNVSIPNHPRGLKFGVDRKYMEVFRDIDLKGTKIGTIYLACDFRNLIEAIHVYIEAGAGILAVSLVLAFFVASRLQGVVSEPIIELASIAEEVSLRKDYSLRATRRRNGADEISNLVHCFNEMLGEIQRRDRGLEDEVEHRTHELKTILDAAGEGIFGIDPSGNVTFMNPAAAKLLGDSSEALVGRCCHDFLHTSSDGTPGPLEACSVCSCTLLPVIRVSRTSTFLRRNHGPFPVEYTASSIVAPGGRPAGVVVTFRDITERQAVERMKSEFVSTVSHELRTPLTSIRGALGLLASGLLGNIAEKGQRMLNIAVSNTDRLVRLINDILDLERMESGRVELKRKVIDANDVMTQAADVMKAMADRAGTNLVVETVHRALWVDSDQIIQTLTNLLSNAVKFSPRGGTVTLSGRGDAKTFTFAVADEGRGIPAGKLEMVFERFKQVDASDSREKGGTGLGLAICRSIVNAHGGRIWAESTEGKGSVFQIALPVRPGDAASMTVEASPAAGRAAERRILICAEERHAMPAIIRTLEQHGFHTELVASREEVFNRAVATRPNAILLDLAGSQNGGWSLLDTLKGCETTRDIPVIVAAGDPPDGALCADRIAQWVRKPWDTSELLHAVTTACQRATILVVEDDLDLARILITALEEQGIHAIHAANGRAAVDAVIAEKPDLIVLDLILPDMDGFAVVDCLKHSRTLGHTPLIVYSAIDVDESQKERLRLGPTEFLTKSRTSLEEFEHRVIQLLNAVVGDPAGEEVPGAA